MPAEPRKETPMAGNDPLLPMFKWTGGKRKELKHFCDLYPDYIRNADTESTYIEPFAGGAAAYFSLNHPGKNIINDFEPDIVNFYKKAASQNKKMLKTVKRMEKLYSEGTHDQQEAEYYRLRNMDRPNGSGLNNISAGVRAGRFYVVNQLAFSGMRRHNSSGEFNVPFGHYKNFNPHVLTSQPHIELLKRTDIYNKSYEKILAKNDTPKTFIFIDPPYTRVMKKYGAGDEFGEDQQRELADQLNSLKHAHYMVVIDRSELTEELYSDNIIKTYSLKYGVNIKNRFSTDVQHIVATNYTP